MFSGHQSCVAKPKDLVMQWQSKALAERHLFLQTRESSWTLDESETCIQCCLSS